MAEGCCGSVEVCRREEGRAGEDEGTHGMGWEVSKEAVVSLGGGRGPPAAVGEQRR